MDAYSPQRMVDRAQIYDVMMRWFRAVDRCDWATVRQVFHPDGHDDHGIYSGDVEGMIAWLSNRHKTVTRSMHCSTNMFIEFADNDNALVETYSLALQRYPAEGAETRNAIAGGADTGDQPFDLLMSGRYVDHFQRRNGEWRIFRRTVIFDNSQMFGVSEGGAKLNPAWTVSKRGADDPIYGLRRQMGIE